MPDLKEIDATYKMKMDAMDDPQQKKDVELEWQKARAEHLDGELTKTRHDQWRQEVLAKFPYASPAEVTGSTKEEFEERAKQSHESFDAKIKEIVAEKDKQIEELQARGAWGAQTAGGGQPSGGGLSTDSEIDQAWKGIREGNLTRNQGERLIKLRTGAIFEKKMEDMKVGPTK